MRVWPCLAALILPAALRAQPRSGPLPGNVVDVLAGNFFFRAPDTLPAGLTTFRLRVLEGGHAMWILRLGRGHHAAELPGSPERASRSWARNLGGPGFPPRHGTVSATLLLEPGEYALVCYVGTGEKSGHGPRTHLQLGMMHAFVVRPLPQATKAASLTSLPSPDVTVTMVDHEFRVSSPPHAGRQIVRIVNAGTVMHEFRLEHVLPGHTGRESLAWNPESGTQQPDEDAGAAATLPPGGAITLIYDFVPGEYTAFCVPQEKHGMKRIVRVLPRRAAGS